MTETPLQIVVRDDGVTIACEQVREGVDASGRRLCCSNACKQRLAGPGVEPPDVRPPQARPQGGHRLLLSRLRYPLPRRPALRGLRPVLPARLGAGGLCPTCDGPVALEGLVGGDAHVLRVKSKGRPGRILDVGTAIMYNGEQRPGGEFLDGCPGELPDGSHKRGVTCGVVFVVVRYVPVVALCFAGFSRDGMRSRRRPRPCVRARPGFWTLDRAVSTSIPTGASTRRSGEARLGVLGLGQGRQLEQATSSLGYWQIDELPAG